jgi:hypothetical protein
LLDLHCGYKLSDIYIYIDSKFKYTVVDEDCRKRFKSESRGLTSPPNATTTNSSGNQINVCCAECGVEGGVSLKMCKSCMQVKYCDATCQKNHWPTHKAACKLRAAELRDEALFKDPPPKEDCPICFLPMPDKLISCVTLPPATISFVPTHEELANMATEVYYPCCGKNICRGCVHSFRESGNMKCLFCNSDRAMDQMKMT